MKIMTINRRKKMFLTARNKEIKKENFFNNAIEREFGSHGHTTL